MTQQRIRIRTDIFQSREFASVKEKADGVPLILHTPVPSRQNYDFNLIDDDDEPEVIYLGNGKDLNGDYNNNHNFNGLPNPTVEDIQGHIIEDEQRLKAVKRTLDNNCIDFVNGSYSCSVCHIGLQKNDIDSHLQGKLHAKHCDYNDNHNSNGLPSPSLEGVNNCIDFVNGRYSCSVCRILLQKDEIESHLQGKKHVSLAGSPAKKAELEKKNQEKKLEKKQKNKQKLAAENEISSSELILVKELNSGKVLRVCRLCDMKLKSECESRDHLRGQYHKATYERYSK